MGQNSQPGSGGHRKLVNQWAPACSVAIAAVLAFTWYYTRLSPGLTLDPWQGLLLEKHPVYDVPTLSWVLSILLRHIPWANAGWVLSLASAGLGALDVALTAAIAIIILRREFSAAAASLYALAGSLLLASCIPAVMMSISGNPAPLTCAFGLTALALLVASAKSTRAVRLLTLSALAAGLATTNHVSFGLLLLIILFTALLFDLAPERRVGRVVAIVLAFSVGAALPALRAWAGGETVASFLYHGLRTPYPTLGDGRPELGYYTLLTSAYCYPALLLALAGLLLVFRSALRAHVTILLLVFACFGPLLPFLTNHYGAHYGLRDPLAPRVFVMAVVGVMAAGGMCSVCGSRALRRRWASWTAQILVLAVAGVLLVLQVSMAPTHHHHYASRITREVLASCPRNSVLLCGNAKLSCLFHAAQRLENDRRDVHVFAVDALVDPHLRMRLARKLGAAIPFPKEFAPQYHFNEYSVEQPFLLRQLANAHGNSVITSNVESDLAIWDIVRALAPTRSICFAGVSTPWLTARAEACGGILIYPEVADAQRKKANRSFEELCSHAIGFSDPDIPATLQSLLLPLSDAARNHGDGPRAEALARLALELHSANPLPHLALARADARQGLNDQAQEHAAAYLRLMSKSGEDHAVIAMLTQDLRCHALQARFDKVLTEGPAESDQRRQAAAALWQTEQLEALNRGYQSLLTRNPHDMDALYERAAALAQLGDFPLANESLRLWQDAGHLSNHLINTRLNMDGRFALINLQARKKGLSMSEVIDNLPASRGSH